MPMLMGMSTQAVLFDLDGTLADTVGLIAGHISDVVTEAAAPIAPEEVLAYIGRPLEVSLQALSGCPASDPLVAEMATRYHARCHGSIEEKREALLIPGVRQMLGDLHAAGYQLGVVTAKTTSEADHLLEAIGIRDALDLVVGTELVTNGKPAPDSALLGLELLGADAAGTWYVGDAASDMAMAVAAGMPGMGITTGAASRAELLAAGAHVVVDSPDEVTAHIAR